MYNKLVGCLDKGALYVGYDFCQGWRWFQICVRTERGWVNPSGNAAYWRGHGDAVSGHGGRTWDRKQVQGKLRKSGIDVIGDVRWGTHFCQFYESKSDLLDILVPYFKAGLESNEFCMWITSEPLGVVEAAAAIREAVGDFNRYVDTGQVEILPHTEWYLKDGKFDSKRVLDGWVEKLNGALSHGYEGLRLTGNTFWLEKKHWEDFLAYEEQVNSIISGYPMLAICTYAIEKCGAADVIDVVNTHQFALARREGKWDRLESSERKEAEARIHELARFPEENPNPVIRAAADGTLLYINSSGAAFLADMGWNRGSALPDEFLKAERQVLEESRIEEFEVSSRSRRTYSFAVSPAGEEGDIYLYGRDITERAAAREALRKSREDLNRAQAVAHTGSWRLDVRRDELLWSDETYRIFGIPKGTPMTYETFLATVDPYDREYVDQKWSAALQGEHYDIEHRIVVDSEIKWVRERAYLEFDKDGTLLGGFGTCQDITELKGAEEQLRASRDRYRSFLEVTGQVGWTTNAKGEVVEDMPAWRKFTGQSFDEIKGWGWADAIHPEDVEHTRKVWTKAVKQKTEYETEYRIRRYDGVWRHFLARSVPAFSEDGSVREWVGTCIDITGRKQAEEALRHSQQDVNRAQQVAHVGSWRLDVKKNELTWSDENHQIFGIPRGEPMTYETFLSCVHPDDKEYVDRKWKAGLRGEPYDIEHRIVVDDQIKWVRERAHLEFDNDGTLTGGFGTTQDVTERKLAEEERQRLLDLLENKNKELQSIVYVASHDLRSPLVNIYGFSGQLGEEYAKLLQVLREAKDIDEAVKKAKPILEKEIPECLTFINAGAQRMQMVINGLLTISRLGNVTLDIRTVNINNIISQIMTSMAYQVQQRGVEVEVDELPSCRGDIIQVNQLFSNILNNAIKYLDPKRKGHIRVTGKVEGEMSVYSVSDNGVGIAEDHKDKIFEIFHRLNPNDGAGGEGLGLSIVLRIVDRHNGKVWVESEPGKGSTFHVALPTA